MPDLQDGESIEMKGSAKKPYVIKNVGGVYSCTCPAWRNQSLAIEQRTCKHIRKLRGDRAEKERVGNALPLKREAKSKQQGPPLLLAHRWENDAAITAFSTRTYERWAMGKFETATLRNPASPVGGSFCQGIKATRLASVVSTSSMNCSS